MTMLAVVTSSSSTLDSRVVLSVRNSYRTTSACRDLINEVIAWSFECMRNLACNTSISFLVIFFLGWINKVPLNSSYLQSLNFWVTISDLPGRGFHPECDPWGRPFSENYHSNRAQKANTRIAGRFHMVLDGVQGDADFIAAIFKLNRLMAGIYWTLIDCMVSWPHFLWIMIYPLEFSLLSMGLAFWRFVSTYPMLLSLQCCGSWSAWIFVYKLGPSSSVPRWVAWPIPAVSKLHGSQSTIRFYHCLYSLCLNLQPGWWLRKSLLPQMVQLLSLRLVVSAHGDSWL